MFDKKEFTDFLMEAKKKTYAGHGKETRPSRLQSKDLPYTRDNYQYLDSYFGDIDFIGQEVVWINGRAAWGMNYYGEMMVANIPEAFSDCLKGALREVPFNAPYRGPKTFTHGKLEYRCEWLGDLESFTGTETISEGGKEIYKLSFHGGKIKSFEG
ncbi:MAG: DUF5680 domain-containing protein [Clostridia bacterium]|nr:DUF5680 domain-containing protein [Clostridia bacterium]